MKEQIQAWLKHMSQTYAGYARQKAEDWLVGAIAILAALMAGIPIFALVKSWWRLWLG